MLVRVLLTNTPLSRRTVRLMIKLTIVLGLVHVFGFNSLYAVGAYLLITRFNTRRSTVPFPYKKSRSFKKKST